MSAPVRGSIAKTVSVKRDVTNATGAVALTAMPLRVSGAKAVGNATRRDAAATGPGIDTATSANANAT
jgi:hypothetical protein